MKNAFLAMTGCCLSLLMGGCASYDTRHADRNQFVTEFYAHVDDIQDIQFESDVPAAAASWGLWGALENSRGSGGDMLGGALAGAFFGGLLTAVMEGPREGYEYHLTAVDGDYLVVVLDNYPAEIGQCVKVRMSSEVRLRAADSIMCDSADDYDQEQGTRWK